MKKGWEVKKLGELCTIKGRIGYRGYTKQDLVPKGEGAITLSPSNIFENKLYFDNCTYISWHKYDESPEIIINEGDIVYCKTASIGKMALVESLPEKATINPQFVVLKNIKCLNKFLYYVMNSNEFMAQAEKITRGVAIPTLSQANLAELSIPIPPLPEQQRVVSVLDEAFASIAGAKSNAERNLVNARELFEAAQRELFEGIGNKNSEVKMLGDVATFRNGINFTKASKGETVKIVGVKDFQNYFWVPLDNLDSVTIDGKLSETDYLRKGDILAVRSNGNQQLIGRTILASDVTEKTTHSGFTIRIRFESKDIFPEYLCHYLKSEKARKQLISGGAGINIKSLNQTTLSELPISLPPLAEQRAIVGRLEALSAETRRLEEIYQQKVESLEELKKSVLAKAFEGLL